MIAPHPSRIRRLMIADVSRRSASRSNHTRNTIVDLKHIDDTLALNYPRLKIAGWIALALILALAVAGMVNGARAEGIAKGSLIPIGAVAEASQWTGFHAGASLGYGFARSEFEQQDNFFTTSDGRINTENLLATVSVGWDLQVSNMVLGLMADVTASDFEDAEWKWFIGARAGVLLTPKTLAYALVGYTETIDGQLAFKSFETTKLQDMAGLTVGGGLEHVLAQGWAARAEYRYVSYGNERAPAGVIDGLVDGSKIDSGEHQVRLGVVKRF